MSMDSQLSRSCTESDLESMLLDEAMEPMALPFSLLEKITNGFAYKQEIGKGGFSEVYKAMLKNEAVAVKRLRNTYMYENEFQREVECLMKVKHKNIVRFLGYCSDTQGKMQRYNGKLVMADVQERCLCFEYVPRGSLDEYIGDASGGLQWTTRFRIIKEICEGIHSLHDINIMHLDLKPSNILIDDNLTPKITDFGLSRSFEEMQTRVVASKMFGTLGYLAPEFTSGVITHKFDLYSLGVIIIEMLTGGKECQVIENILESWDKRMHQWQEHSYREQIRVCAEIGMECRNIDPAKRPVSMKHVMTRLHETESTEYSHELLDDCPLEHCFYPEVSESTLCWLQLTNKTDEHVVFRLMKSSGNSLLWCSVHEMYGGVPGRSSCTLIVTTEEKKLAQTSGSYIVLQSSISSDKNVMLLKDQYACTKFFEEAKELGREVHEVAIKACCTPRQREMASEPNFLKYYEILSSMDAHPTEPWIVIGCINGNVTVWNHESKTTMVGCIKFDTTKKWIVSGTADGLIHVYDCVCVTQIQKIASFKTLDSFLDVSMAIHAVKPYVLSSSMELWDGDKGWECTHKFGVYGMCKLAFNPEDTNSFAATIRHYVEVWSLDSAEPDYTLNEHSDKVKCLAFFKRGDRQYLITGSNDCTAKIWDMQKRMCIHTIEGFMSPVMLKTTVNFSGSGHVRGIVCLTGSRRVAVGQMSGISIMDIDGEE
ncbi:hypothetical protein QYE76_036501 [Lolium multiflorum]|uniref:Protein kinase domain-containing protein n=1 Tax=Lolium multiflorum TaxID=4521 RepID=A0AAD8VQ74_LOLMU|nr:hypothetical protein QYE76_036501 [Lolium multiflorum]